MTSSFRNAVLAGALRGTQFHSDAQTSHGVRRSQPGSLHTQHPALAMAGTSGTRQLLWDRSRNCWEEDNIMPETSLCSVAWAVLDLFFFLFLNLSLVKKWPIAHMSGGKSINVWQVNTDPSSKYSPSTHSVCGKKSHTFTV